MKCPECGTEVADNVTVCPTNSTIKSAWKDMQKIVRMQEIMNHGLVVHIDILHLNMRIWQKMIIRKYGNIAYKLLYYV